VVLLRRDYRSSPSPATPPRRGPVGRRGGRGRVSWPGRSGSARAPRKKEGAGSPGGLGERYRMGPRSAWGGGQPARQLRRSGPRPLASPPRPVIPNPGPSETAGRASLGSLAPAASRTLAVGWVTATLAGPQTLQDEARRQEPGLGLGKRPPTPTPTTHSFSGFSRPCGNFLGHSGRPGSLKSSDSTGSSGVKSNFPGAARALQSLGRRQRSAREA
jgi:hypothetical protein